MKIYFTKRNVPQPDGSNKTFTNYYLCLDSGHLIPISVKYFDKQRYILDITRLDAVAVSYDYEKNNK